MKFLQIAILIFSISSCATNSDFASANISQEKFDSIEVGAPYFELNEKLGTSYRSMQSGNEMILTYTQDVTSAGMSTCSDVNFILESKDGIYKLTKKEIVQSDRSIKRCNPSQMSSGDAALFGTLFVAGLADADKRAVDERIEESNKARNRFCYIDNYGKERSCYSSLESCEDTVKLYSAGFCVWNR